MTARPFWSDVTDGVNRFTREGDYRDATVTLCCYVREAGQHDYYLFLNQCEDRDGWRTIADTSEEAPRLQPPPGYTAGDSVCCVGDTFLFFNSKGELYSSMSPCNNSEEPATVLFRAYSQLVEGWYETGRNQELVIGWSNEQLTLFTTSARGSSTAEPITFGAPVPQAGGPSLIHLVGKTRHWLAELTPQGLNLYAAVIKGDTVERGKLQMTGKVQSGLRNGPYRYNYPQLALPHLLAIHCSSQLKAALLNELGPQQPDDANNAARFMLQLF